MRGVVDTTPPLSVMRFHAKLINWNCRFEAMIPCKFQLFQCCSGFGIILFHFPFARSRILTFARRNGSTGDARPFVINDDRQRRQKKSTDEWSGAADDGKLPWKNESRDDDRQKFTGVGKLAGFSGTILPIPVERADQTYPLLSDEKNSRR